MLTPKRSQKQQRKLAQLKIRPKDQHNKIATITNTEPENIATSHQPPLSNIDSKQAKPKQPQRYQSYHKHEPKTKQPPTDPLVFPFSMFLPLFFLASLLPLPLFASICVLSSYPCVFMSSSPLLFVYLSFYIYLCSLLIYTPSSVRHRPRRNRCVYRINCAWASF